MRSSFVVMSLALLLGACVSAPPTAPPATPAAQSPPSRIEEQTREAFRKALDDFDRDSPRPHVCNIGFQPSRSGYVAFVAEWAARAGLSRGDRITAINGVPADTPELRGRGWASVRGDSFTLTVERDRRSVTVTLPCRSDTERWTALRALLQAGAEGAWDACDAAARRTVALVGFTTSRLVFNRLQCRGASRRLTASEQQQLQYDIARLIIAEASVTPGELDSARGTVLRYIAALKNANAHTLADDLDRQLAAASRAGRAAPGPASRSGVSHGTGFVVRPNGVLVTAHHVVRNARTITVKCSDRDALPATLVNAAPGNDLAVLRVTSPATLPYLPIAPARSARVGDPVFTVGFPASALLGSEPKFTEGSISALSGPGGEQMVLQISVPIQPGNSGGALVTESGDVVGIISSTAAVQPFLAATGTLPQNVNWAVKADYVLPLFDLPERVAPASGRREAIDRALRATCAIEARQ